MLKSYCIISNLKLNMLFTFMSWKHKYFIENMADFWLQYWSVVGSEVRESALQRGRNKCAHSPPITLTDSTLVDAPILSTYTTPLYAPSLNMYVGWRKVKYTTTRNQSYGLVKFYWRETETSTHTKIPPLSRMWTLVLGRLNLTSGSEVCRWPKNISVGSRMVSPKIVILMSLPVSPCLNVRIWSRPT